MALPSGASTNLFLRIVYGLAAPYHQSPMTPESVYVAVSLARVKMQDGREGRGKKEKQKQKQNITPRQSKTDNRGGKKMYLVEQTGLQRLW